MFPSKNSNGSSSKSNSDSISISSQGRGRCRIITNVFLKTHLVQHHGHSHDHSHLTNHHVFLVPANPGVQVELITQPDKKEDEETKMKESAQGAEAGAFGQSQKGKNPPNKRTGTSMETEETD